MQFFATAPKGLEGLLADELGELGADDVRESRAGARFHGSLEVAYRVCLWSRIANRILLPLATFEVSDADALYDGLRAVAWHEHLDADRSLAVDGSTTGSCLTHSQFAALRVKDAIVDHFRDRDGRRPRVCRRRPDVRINLHVRHASATVSIDLSGDSLHRRGYRSAGLRAPLKENLAAAILRWAGWPRWVQRGGPFLDPMCGSGTLCIEAALIALDVAPGLGRRRFGFERWSGHDPGLFERLRDQALARRERGSRDRPRISGSDADQRAIRVARANAQRAGLAGVVRFERRDFVTLAGGWAGREGLVVTNPPYGERLGDAPDLAPLYTQLGQTLASRLGGWHAVVLCGSDELGKRLGLRATRRRRVFNGALECRLVEVVIPTSPAGQRRDGRQMLHNRLRKNLRRLARWAEQGKVTCYRVYDADLPEYAVAIDRYESWVVVQEYEPPPAIDPRKAARRLADVLEVVPEALGMPPDAMTVKVRRRQRRGSQYNRLSRRGDLVPVSEGDLTFLVNLTDYLDTGLFLDGRRIRAMIRQLAGGQRFLNLFAYTGTATVCAAKGGATATTSVDMSKTYLAWAHENLRKNNITGRQHQLVAADCLEWLARARRRYGLIYLDPPTYSLSKRMAQSLDLQRDHVSLVGAAARLLTPGGVLLFSSHARRFELDTDGLAGLRVEEISRETVDLDFARRHSRRCWRIERP